MSRQQKSKRNQKSKKNRKRSVMCQECGVNRRWHGGPCSICRDKLGLDLPKPVRSGKQPRAGRARKRRAAADMGYHERQLFLEELGFASYRAYLDSDLWASIRDRVFGKSGRWCWVCRHPCAAQVHHAKYTRANLSGESLRHLHPICAVCHQEIEKDGDRKRDRREVRKVAADLRRSADWRRKLGEFYRQRRESAAEFARSDRA